MDYWKEVDKFVNKMQTEINNYNALKLRSRSEYCASIIESSKYAMYAGRSNRAWALLLLARYFWKKSRR